MARLIERDFPKTPEGICLAFASPDSDRLGADTLLMLAHCMRSELGSRVLLVDARLSDYSNGITSRLDLQALPGFADHLQGLGRVEDLIRPTAVPNVFVLPAGDASGWGAPIEREQIRELLQAVRANYRFVLLQIGSPLGDTRSMLTALEADAVMLLVKENETLMSVLDKCRKVLADNGVADVRVVVSGTPS